MKRFYLLAPILFAGCSGGTNAPGGSEPGLIVYGSSRSGESDIWLMAPDGSNEKRVTFDAETDTQPSLNTAHTRVAFQSTRGLAAAIGPRHFTSVGNIWVADLNTAGRSETSARITNSGKDFSPAWSKDGTRLVFRSEREENSEIYVMNADGSNQTRLTANPADDIEPEISPDGSQIAFASDRDNARGRYDIYVMNADGSNIRRLTRDNGDNHGPVFSPDGTRLAFASTRSGNSDIWTIKIDGSDVQQITTSASNDRFPAWSPDGLSIAFQSSRPLVNQIWKIRLADRLETQLTNDPLEADFPDWK
jgi:tol-pal system beta propeller repeat protein TolB